TTGINAAWLKLEKYFKLTDYSPLYIAAVVLHPSKRFEYFEDKWQRQPDWILHAKKSFHKLYHEYYNEIYWDADTESDHQQEEPKSAYHAYTEISSEFLSKRRKKSMKDKDKGSLEYDCYIKSFDEKLKVKDPLVWWKVHDSDYPILAQMAFDILSIP